MTQHHTLLLYISFVFLFLFLYSFSFFFFNDTATTEIYTLSLHDALPISSSARRSTTWSWCSPVNMFPFTKRSEEHTSELQSRFDLVCRLLLEKKKKKTYLHNTLRGRCQFNRTIIHTTSCIVVSHLRVI